MSDWFTESRFGMFIHWGIYAVPARGEWVASIEKIPADTYGKYAEKFNPDNFDARLWARAAKDAGMKYAVMTAKHHDGFCMFDSALTEYKHDRDYVREFLEAFRAEGLRVGLYYSLLDWHHPDYPRQNDPYHPERGAENSRPDGDFDRYLDYMHGQVREICSNYGVLDLLWLDFSYDEMTGEKWRAAELVKTVRGLQPDILINNRLTVDAGDKTYGDFLSPEQFIPSAALPAPWEVCLTTNGSWGYNAGDTGHKSADTLIKKLVEVVSKNGNLILNVGPDARGNIPAPALKTLSGIGDWLRRNGGSIYGCGASDLPKPQLGRITQKGDKTLYFHFFEEAVSFFPLEGFCRADAERAASVRRISDNSEWRIRTDWFTDQYPETLFASPTSGAGIDDTRGAVVELTLKW